MSAYLHGSQVFVKIISYYRFWENLDIYEMNDLKINLEESLLLTMCIVNNKNLPKKKLESFLSFLNINTNVTLANEKLNDKLIKNLFYFLKLFSDLYENYKNDTVF